jgi:hypothetical protein
MIDVRYLARGEMDLPGWLLLPVGQGEHADSPVVPADHGAIKRGNRTARNYHHVCLFGW